MVSLWNLSSRKSPQVSDILLGILVDLNNGVVWTVSTHPLIFTSSVPVSIHLWLYQGHILQLVPSSLACSIDFFYSLARYRYSSLFLLSFNITLLSARTVKFNIRQGLVFCWVSPGLVIWAKFWDLFLSQNRK